MSISSCNNHALVCPSLQVDPGPVGQNSLDPDPPESLLRLRLQGTKSTLIVQEELRNKYQDHREMIKQLIFIEYILL